MPTQSAPRMGRPTSRRNSLRRISRSLVSTPGSRNSSRGRSGSIGSLRGSKVDVYSRNSFNQSADNLTNTRRWSGVVGLPPGKTAQTSEVKRWDGNRRTTTAWDCLRRDPELWFPSGDCLVHFYEHGQSRRGPSMRLSLADIEMSNCRPLLEKSCAHPVPESPESSASTSSEDGGYFTNPTSTGKYELYIAAPQELNREDAFKYHLTTRNFFAWMFEKPVVGPTLGDALISLQERMDDFRPDKEENEDDMLAYLDSQGYTDFRECPDHALAVLRFAEKFQYKDLWTDAFVHCVGMNDRLISSAEFEGVSRTSKALITRAHLEMGLRLEHVSYSLGSFLEDDFNGNCFGLPYEAHAHLERFRTFLHSFYVQRHGYWPPTGFDGRQSQLSKSTLLSMYFDFRNLYEYLADQNSSSATQDAFLPEDRIFTYQNILAFDRKFKHTPLPHPLSLIPAPAENWHRQKPTGLSKLFANKQAKLERRTAALSALTAATNSNDFKIMECALVRQYLLFEKEWTVKEEEKIPPGDARKVRWILIYAILQTIISVTRAPIEVRDTEAVTYSLCCQTAGTPPWTITKTPKVESLAPVPPRKGSIPTPSLDFNRSQTSPARSRRLSHTRVAPTIALPTDAQKAQSKSRSRKPFREILVNEYGNGLSRSGSTATQTEHVISLQPSTPSTPSDAANSGWSHKDYSSSDDGLSLRDIAHSMKGNKLADYASSVYGDGLEDEEPEPEPVPVPSLRELMKPKIIKNGPQPLWKTVSTDNLHRPSTANRPSVRNPVFEINDTTFG
ncbi:MAG: hypothetical protein MMC33_000363 [Icmadophila ericetorum]|nr:hypothetical protein [Icmadophila ericetorum]